MAETYPNPFYGSSPLGDALRNLSTTIMSGPTEAQRILQAEQALKAQTQRQGTSSLSGIFQQYGQPGFDRNAAMSSAITAGYDPKHLAEMERYGSANIYGVNDPRTSAAGVGAGTAFGSTPQGFRESEARHFYEFNNKPQVYGTDQGPVIGTVQTAIGKPAVEPLANVQGNAARVAMNSPGGIGAQPPAMQRFIHADPKTQTPHTYGFNGQSYITYDGTTDARTGQPLPRNPDGTGGYMVSTQGDLSGVGLTSNVKGHLAQQDIALQRLSKLGDYAQSLVKPENVGIPGIVKSFTQNAAETASNVAKGMGYPGLQDALADMRNRAVQSGADPKLLSGLFTFDPNLPKLETAYHMLVLSGAEALAGGVGKASDRDMRVVTHMLGSPESLFASPSSLNAKMQGLQEGIGIMRGNIQSNLRPGASMPGAQAQPGGSVAPPPAAPPGAPPVERWDIGPDGRPVRVQ